MDKTTQILIIDDDTDFASFIFDVAQTMHLNCIMTTNSDDFMKAFNPEVTLIFLDLIIPGIDGIELLRFLGKQQCKSNIILMSGVDKRVLEVAQDFAASIGLSVVERIQKPIRLIELENILKKNVSFESPMITEPQHPSKSSFVVTADELKRAIKENEFVVYYQPKIDIAIGKIVGVEALVRWLHPKQGLIFPDQFISLAESFGLIDDLGWLVAKKGLTEIAEINQAIQFELTISLNLSPYSLHDLTYPDKFIALVTRSKIKPENIIIEITESAVAKELSSALDIFTRLRMKQIKLSIDDFGTGYAMMQQLKHVPASELKIDKSFIQGMLTEDSSRVTVKKMIEIGHELGMKVIAEGVETKEQLQFLQNNHCDIIQGYFFSKPLPMAALLDWIKVFNAK